MDHLRLEEGGGVQHLPGLLFCVGPQGVKPLPVAGEAHWHQGDAPQPRPVFRQVPKALFQGGAVVDAGTEDQLGVHPDPRLGEHRDIPQALGGLGVFQHLHPQVRVGGMHRNIDGGKAHLDNPADILLGEVGEGDIAAKQEGHTAVVVLYIEGIPQPPGQLVHKAEDALVAAGVLPVHQVGFKLQPQVVVLPLAHRDGKGRPVPPEGKLQAAIGHIKAVVQHVPDGLAVDGLQGIAGADALSGRQASRLHPLDDNRHRALSSPACIYHLSLKITRCHIPPGNIQCYGNAPAFCAPRKGRRNPRPGNRTPTSPLP